MPEILLPGDDVKNEMPSYFNLPSLDIFVAFPQATPASTFPPCETIRDTFFVGRGIKFAQGHWSHVCQQT
ncbi:hypothetical protein QN277_009006 [Acacia crassicarpa]|uniref:Uncharacterized protein n=1 Tax=Acacia crassicarpa TaxID=499986 RepID=A0AAE1IU08_9FABA|nr:hypothetical protein QN277_009006 [Acacia crassicarpa]